MSCINMLLVSSATQTFAVRLLAFTQPILTDIKAHHVCEVVRQRTIYFVHIASDISSANVL